MLPDPDLCRRPDSTWREGGVRGQGAGTAAGQGRRTGPRRGRELGAGSRGEVGLEEVGVVAGAAEAAA